MVQYINRKLFLIKGLCDIIASMKITILCIGKIKEEFFRKAIAEYVKRLSRYCRLEIIESADEKTTESASSTEQDKIKEKEGERILKNMRDDTYVIALALGGREFDSEGLSKHIEKLGVNGSSHITFIIGGSLGLSKDVLKRADEQICFSKMTFPHQLMRVILLEQIYRSYRIMNHEPYHK